MRGVAGWSKGGTAALLLLAGCSDRTEQPTNHVVDARPVSSAEEPRAVTDPVTPDRSSPRDSLAEAALDAQQALLRSDTEEAQVIAGERDARAAIYGRINLKFRDAVADLQEAGVVFEGAQGAVNILNVMRRQQGVYELQTTYQDPRDQFRIVDDLITSGPFGVVLLKGTNHPQSFRGWIRGEVLDYNGSVSEQCRVAVPFDSGEKLLSCRSVIAGLEDIMITNLAKAYLVSEMQ